MRCSEIILIIVNVLAVLAAPVIAVWIGQCLQNREAKRKDKMEVFKAVMTDRYGWSRDTVLALNSIPIVFSNDKPVRDSWKEYYKQLCIQKPNEMEKKQRNDALCALIEKMSISLGYGETINWNDIQNPYIPQGMADSFDNATVIQSQMANIARNISAASTNANCQQEAEKPTFNHQ